MSEYPLEGEEKVISAYEYNVIYIALYDRISSDIKKMENRIKYCKEEDKYLKLHYSQKLTELKDELYSIKMAHARAYKEGKE